MKALTIKQPWASLIATGIKDIENRTWRTKFRGRIYIHAAAGYDNRHRNMKSLFLPEQWLLITDKKLTQEMIAGLWIKSAIIGEVDIIDCVINHTSVWAEKTEGAKVGHHFYYNNNNCIWNWVLANPVLYDSPILNVKGKLSFWEYGVN